MILCVGLTPTVQRTMRFRHFALGSVNRAAETVVSASGKAVNVARVLTTLGATIRLVHPLGGDSGRYITAELTRAGISAEPIDAGDDTPTRTCTTLLFDDGTPTTELVEESRPLSAEALATTDAAIARQIPQAAAIACSGSLTPGAPADFYARIVAAGRAHGIPVLVDAQKEPLKAALAERPFLVKPNREEAAATLGLTLTGNPLADATTAIRALCDAGAEWALVSMGRDGSLLGNREADTLWRIEPPAVDALNPIGSGDSLAAGTLYALVEQGKSVPDAVAYGTACGAANTLSLTSGVIDTAVVARLLTGVVVTTM